MALTQSTLRSILAQILLVDQKYIVPKQGNWWNPQDQLNEPNKPRTWIAHKIGRARPVSTPCLDQIESSTPGDPDDLYSLVDVISVVDLQIVGAGSEELAQSFMHWPARADVATFFGNHECTLMDTELGYTVTEFYQDGVNDIVAYNIRLNIAWINRQAINQTVVTEVSVTGDVITGGINV